MTNINYHQVSEEMEQAWETYIQAYPNDYKSVAFVAFMAGWNARSNLDYQWIERSDFSQIPDDSLCWCLLNPKPNRDNKTITTTLVLASWRSLKWIGYDPWCQDFEDQIIVACVIPVPSSGSVDMIINKHIY